MLGSGISAVDVVGVAEDGVQIVLGEEGLFLPYSEFPWFRGADPDKVRRVERPSAGHLYWPLLDIDLSVDSIRNPAAFPLRARLGS